MLSSTLRRGGAYLRCHNVARSAAAGGRSLASSCATSRWCGSQGAIGSFRPSRAAAYIARPRDSVTRPTSLLQTCRLSTQDDASRQKPRFLIDPSEKLPDIYASPTALVEKVFDNDVVPLDSKSVYIAKDGEYEEWHTATYIDSRSKEHFHSGTFGGYWDRMATKNQCDVPEFSSEETCVVDGRVHYRSEKTAREAAAARVLDCFAFRLKQRRSFVSLEPLRYCEELPHFFMLNRNKASTFPAYYWACLMHSKYGPIDARFDVKAAALKNGNAMDAGSESEETWFTASCIEPKTGESFDAGVFGASEHFARNYMPDAPKTPLQLEEVRIHDGRVYYRVESTAKHAAAARALDCINYRATASGTDDGNKELNTRLCMEEPYLTPDDKQRMSSTTQLKELEEVVQRRRNGQPGFSFSDFIKLELSEGGQSQPLSLLAEGFLSKYNMLVTNSWFGLSSLEDSDGFWYTAIFTDPISKEEFGSGIVRAPKDEAPDPFHTAAIRTIAGKVYYSGSASHAIQAAAARALDCYVMRDKGLLDGESSHVPFCYEEPYMAAEEGASQTNDYGTLLAQRNEDITSLPNPEHNPFSSFAKSNSYLLHVPKDFLTRAFSKANDGTNIKIGRDTFEVQMQDVGGKNWHTATFMDPITKELFSSGLVGREINVDKRTSNVLGTPLHQAETTVLDGRVYYLEAKLAEHAAAARAVDCYILREGDGSCDHQLCLEEPYSTAEEGRSQTIDYDALLSQRVTLRAFDNNQSSFTRQSNDSTFSSYAKSKPYLLHVPKNFLYDTFARAHGTRINRDAFSVQMQEIGGKSWFTATFTDPVTKETFSSGLGREINAERRADASIKPPLHLAEAAVFDGTVYYLDSKLAEHAAAARAVDCYILREGDGSNDIRLCHEEPYSSAEEGRSQKIDYDALLAQRGSNTAEGYAEPAPISRATSSTFSSFAKNSYLLHVPKQCLYSAFARANGIEIGRDAFEVQKHSIGGKSWFTATYTDPITKEKFPSGLGREINVEKRRSTALSTPLHQAETTVLDGRVYYREEKLAEHAAAARAIDCYLFREGDSMKSNLRLCLEDPYKSAEEGRSQKVDYDALMAQRSIPPADGDHLSAEFDRVEVSYPAIETTENELPSLDLLFTEEPTNIDKSLSTMGRIAEIWTDAASGDLDSSGGTSPQWSDGPTIELDNDPQSKIESILQWYDGIENEPRNHAEASELAHLCNKILTALGKVIKELDFEEAENHTDVEGDARIILDRILSLSSTFDDKNDPPFFDADTFNAYIHCLDRLDPARSAKIATQLLRSMIDGQEFDGIDLPPPNVGTYNSVMSLWAQVGGVEGQNGVNDVHALLESASQGGGSELPLRPNKDTWNLLLAVNSKTDGRFSFEQAKMWLDKLQRISDSSCGEAFVPDAGVYSAALTSLSSKANADPTNSQCAKSWLTRGRQYDGGFKSADESSDAEASDIAEWLLHAEECGVAPSREMYEAVIQAWTETGTKDGLLTAEAWASRYIRWAVESGSPIRLETFHPIIAAWALCQLERAPDRVSEWNEQLTSLGATRSALKPDLNTISAQVIAWRNVQAGMMATSEESMQLSTEDFNAQRDVEKAFAIAQNCTQYLKEVFADDTKELKSQQDAAAVTSMFTNTIESWGCASRFALRHPTSSVTLDASRGADEVLNVARLFDAKMNQSETEEKAQRMLSVMGESFAEVVSQLHQIDSAIANSATDSDAARCYFSDKLPHVERMMRDYEFYSRKHLSPGSFSPESKATRHRLYSEILRGCAGITSSADFGHVMRINRLIMDHLAWQSEHCPEGGARTEQDITDLFVDIALLAQTAVPIVEERMYTLATMHVHADQFFEKRRKSEASAYATVDRARLIGAMRMAMGDSELTEEFIQRIDGRSKTNARGNTALAFVEELLRK